MMRAVLRIEEFPDRCLGHYSVKYGPFFGDGIHVFDLVDQASPGVWRIRTYIRLGKVGNLVLFE